MNGDQPYAFLFRGDVPSLTPSMLAFCCVARMVRLSSRAITLVFVFSRAMVFSTRTSSLVHGRGFFVFFAIALSTPEKKPADKGARCARARYTTRADHRTNLGGDRGQWCADRAASSMIGHPNFGSGAQ